MVGHCMRIEPGHYRSPHRVILEAITAPLAKGFRMKFKVEHFAALFARDRVDMFDQSWHVNFRTRATSSSK
jgi:hypothetical protein